MSFLLDPNQNRCFGVVGSVSSILAGILDDPFGTGIIMSIMPYLAYLCNPCFVGECFSSSGPPNSAHESETAQPPHQFRGGAPGEADVYGQEHEGQPAFRQRFSGPR